VGYVFAYLKIAGPVVVLRLRSLLDTSILFGKPQWTRFECSVVQIQNEYKAPEVKSCSDQKIFVEECGDPDLLTLNFQLIAHFPSNI